MQAIKIKNDIYWIGAVDFVSHDFHGYSISPRGTTYNSYLVKDKKNVLFDTVKFENFDTMLSRLKSVINPEEIDYIVVNHAELDHAGCLAELIKLCKPEKVICSIMGKKSIEAHFDTTGWNLEAVKTGDSINIGSRNIQFIEARMLHWPDSMFAYIPEDKLLITNDAFGQNIATTERFADELPRNIVEYVMGEYYNNIILPYSQKVLTLLKQISEMNLDIDMIAPDHGLIFRGKDEVKYALDAYRRFAEQKPNKKAVIIYDTMWHSTEKMAYAISEGLYEVGVPSRIMFIKNYHHSEVMTEIANCGLVIMGCPTHNNDVLPSMAAMMTYMKGLRPKNRIGGAFGSFGWSGEAPIKIYEHLKAMEMEMPVEPIKHNFVPDEKLLQQCYEMGKTLGEALVAKCNSNK